MKLLIYHVSGHQDDHLLQPIWSKIVMDGEFCAAACRSMAQCSIAEVKDVDPQVGADRLIAKVVPIGQRFYPSDAAFPVRK